MDYLSFITIRRKDDPQFPCLNWQDYIVLNSTANLPKSLSRLAGYEKTHCFLDNDTAGRAAYRELEKELGLRVRDASCHYSEYKDLNDYLQDKSNQKKQVREDNTAVHFKRQIPMKKKGRGL
jgi:DNA primase